MSDKLRTFDSAGHVYDEAFRAFLAHTDQKIAANEWLLNFVKNLPTRNLFVDAGAGEGTITNLLKGLFARTVAIEPNPLLAKNLVDSGGIEVLQEKIGRGLNVPPADLILCSHVFYLLPPQEWLDLMLQMASWLAPKGSLVILNQSKDTDCGKMSRHFYGPLPHLSSLYDSVEQRLKDTHGVRLEAISSHIVARDGETACRIAEFILGGNENVPAPSRTAVQEYLDSHSKEGSTYRMSCHQDVFIVYRRS